MAQTKSLVPLPIIMVILALRVVIAGRDSDQPKSLHGFIWQHRGLLCFPGGPTNLRNQKVHSKWRILIDQLAVELRDLFAQHLRRIA